MNTLDPVAEPTDSLLTNAPVIGRADTDELGAIVAPALRDLDQLAGQLKGWLSTRIPDAKGIRISNLHYPRGSGQSHETILFDAVWTENGRNVERGLVVRIKPTSFLVFQDEMFVEEFQLMRALHRHGGVPVAEALWFEEAPTLLGAPFFVMEKLQGRVPVSIPSYMETGWVVDASPAQRRRAWESGVRALATLQTIPISTFDFLDRPEVGDGFEQEWDRWRRYLDMTLQERPLPFLQAAWARLAETRPAHRPEGLTWGDARFGNLMFGDDFQVIAMMDWEQPSLGGALQDLGWWLFHERAKIRARGGTPLAGLGNRRETVALWRSVTGTPTMDLDWYEAFAGFKTACLLVHMLDMKNEVPEDGDYSLLWPCLEIAPMLGLTHDS